MIEQDILRLLQIEPSSVDETEVLHEGRVSLVVRLRIAGRGCILKRHEFVANAEYERSCYELLEQLDVPVPTLLKAANRALLMEDLDDGMTWRLATREDLVRKDVGAGLAKWYRRLHEAGRALGDSPRGFSAWLKRETDDVNHVSLIDSGEKLGLSDAPAWQEAIRCCDDLMKAMVSLPQTLIYNDFSHTNVAIRCCPDAVTECLMFDYHLLGLGPVYSDIHNVSTALLGDARQAFMEACSPVEIREQQICEAVGILVALVEAASRPTLPAWARPALAQVTDGSLQRLLCITCDRP